MILCIEYGKEIANFGAYYQNGGATKSPIEWIVLAKEGGKALLISKYAIDCKPYNDVNKDIRWDSCTLRKWLNSDFINEAFSIDEQRRIQTTYIQTSGNSETGIDGGSATYDKAFLLSVEEANRYFRSDSERQTKRTPYAVSNCICGNYDFFWLRSPGAFEFCSSFVNADGRIKALGSEVFYSFGVRPAMWVSL